MTEKQEFIIRSKDIRHNAARAVAQIASEPVMSVTIQPHKTGRSVAQNRLLWMWYGEIRNHLAETTGEQYTNDDIHEYFKDKFLDKRVVDIGERPIVVTASTSKLNTSDMSEYLNRLDIYCADDLQLQLTHPSDLWHESMGK